MIALLLLIRAQVQTQIKVEILLIWSWACEAAHIIPFFCRQNFIRHGFYTSLKKCVHATVFLSSIYWMKFIGLEIKWFFKVLWRTGKGEKEIPSKEDHPYTVEQNSLITWTTQMISVKKVSNKLRTILTLFAAWGVSISFQWSLITKECLASQKLRWTTSEFGLFIKNQISNLLLNIFSYFKNFFIISPLTLLSIENLELPIEIELRLSNFQRLFCVHKLHHDCPDTINIFRLRMISFHATCIVAIALWQNEWSEWTFRKTFCRM